VAVAPELLETITREDAIKKTIFHDTHVALGAKMAPFGGYLMPIQYSGILKEHIGTRERATIFDTCHMGEFRISGPDAAAGLETVLSCPVAQTKVGACRYGFICNESGGVIDDQIFYRISEDEFFMVVNASTSDNDFEWLRAHMPSSVRMADISSKTAKLDLQGPASARIMNKLMDLPIDNMKYYTWAKNRYRGNKVLISRTGYTGEIGFEIYCSNGLAPAFWTDCLANGVIPAGLGARDTLRLEMGFPLYGHELDERTDAAESGFSRAIAADKTFIGSKVVLDAKRRRRKLVGIAIDGRRAARHNDTILNAAGKAIGRITSGSFSPSLSCAIAFGYVAVESSAIGTPFGIVTERSELTGKVTDLPFYKKATGRKDLKEFLQ
jgi:aminomethyltransferase